MRILLVTQYYYPEMGAPQARLHELATRMSQKGHDVTVLTAMPNYPTGRIYPGYRGKLRCMEVRDGIRIIRTCLYPSNSSKTLPRLLSYLSFATSIILLGIWRLGKQDIVLVESPPLFLSPAGWIICRLKRAKSIIMVSDIWPDLIVRIGYTTQGISLKLMYMLEKWAYNHYDAVALTNPGAMEQINNRFPEVKTTVISNGVDTEFFTQSARNSQTRQELGADKNTFLFGYCGLHGLAQGLEAVIDAAEILKNKQSIKIAMVGDGPEKNKLLNLAKAYNISNINFLERRSKHAMPKVLTSCDAMFVPLSVELPGTMPSKIYEAFSAGSPPIVAKGCEGEKLVKKYNAGLVYTPMDGNSLAQSMLKMAENPIEYQKMRKNCIKVAAKYDRNILADQTEKILFALHNNENLPEINW